MIVYFFYGEDTFRASQKVHAIMNKYIDSAMGDTNLARLDGGTTTVDEIMRQVFANPFLASKRLVVLENFLLESSKETQEKILKDLPNFPSSTVVLFWERGTPDKRSKLFHALNKPKQAECFLPLEEKELSRWIDNYFVGHVMISPAARAKLIQWVGSDLWRMNNECAKLALAANDEGVTLELVEQFVVPSVEATSFPFLDSLFEDSPESAVAYYQKLNSIEESPLPLLSLINGTVAKIIMLKDWHEHGMQPTEMNAKAKLHPFQFKKLLTEARKHSWRELADWQELLIALDGSIKSGKIEMQQSIWTLIACWFTRKKLEHILA